MMHQMLNSPSLGGSIRDNNRTSLTDGRSVGVGNYVGSKVPQDIYRGL
jgi:hypothetical protein